MNLLDVLGFSNGFNRCGGGGAPPLWCMSKGEAMRPWMRMSACIQERGCEMLEEDAGMHISFVYLLDSVWREYIYIYI